MYVAARVLHFSAFIYSVISIEKVARVVITSNCEGYISCHVQVNSHYESNIFAILPFLSFGDLKKFSNTSLNPHSRSVSLYDLRKFFHACFIGFTLSGFELTTNRL